MRLRYRLEMQAPQANRAMFFSLWFPGRGTRLLECLTGLLWLALWVTIAIDHGEVVAGAVMMSLQG